LSKIVITNDFQKAVSELDADERIEVKELKIEDIEKIKNIAYMASREKRTILIAAEKYPPVSQNALLKLLEEPPQNVDFILLAKSKYSLLETIKSRLPLEKREYKTELRNSIDITTLSNDKILELLKGDYETEELKAMIYDILKSRKLDGEQMELLGECVRMLELNIDKKAVLAVILLNIKEKF